MCATRSSSRDDVIHRLGAGDDLFPEPRAEITGGAQIDPMADDVVKDLYGKILLITIPLLTLGGMVLGYLIMTSRTTGESAYAARAVTPRFVVGATLSILGIFLVSVFAQFVIATDLAMVGVAVPAGAVGEPDDWPAAGGVFRVLQSASFDPRITEGPNNWNTGAWLSAGRHLEPARADIHGRAGEPVPVRAAGDRTVAGIDPGDFHRFSRRSDFGEDRVRAAGGWDCIGGCGNAHACADGG